MNNKLLKFLVLVVINIVSCMAYSQAPKDQSAPLTVTKTKVYKTIGLTRLKLYIFQPTGCKKGDRLPGSGYFDGSGVRILGQMAIQRVGDLLPYDYNPDFSKHDTVRIIKGTLPDQKNYSNYLQAQPANDSLIVIEKIYLHTDRSYYYSGDDIWFKAYLIEAADRLLTNHSKNLHVELISPSLKIISDRIVRLDSGLGRGDFKLPDELRSGKYKLRAYTNYMRNFSDQLFFSKKIDVINPADKQDENSDEVKYVANNIRLTFFPEGGSLVDNVSSIVAFKAINSLEKGCDVAGKIYSSAGDLITTFKSTHLGMGSFFLRPIPGLSYYSIFRGDDSIDVRTEIPTSFSAGVTLGVSINQDNELLITTKTNPKTLTLVFEKDLLLTFSRRKEVIKTIRYKINAPVTNFVIPTDDLPDGILMLSLSTLEDLPLSERLVYNQREAPLSIRIETDKLFYSKREPVSLKISLSGDSTLEKKGNVSLAVVNESLTEKISQFPRTISSWFLLESDVHGFIEDPSYYFDPLNTERFRDLDLLLRTQGWRDFAWKYDTTYFPPENGFTLSGRLKRYYGNKSLEGSRVSIGIFGSGHRFLTTVPVDSSGRFKVSGIDFTGEARLIVTGIGKKDHLKGVMILDSVNYIPAKVSDSLSSVSTLIENKWSSLKTYYEINESIRKKYKLSDTISLGEVKIISERPKDAQTVKVERSRVKYVNPDSEVIITQQMQGYNYLIEILRGHVPGFVVTGSYPDYKVQIRGIGSINAQGAPLVLIDGNQATFEDLISMPIPAIDRIDVLKSVFTTNIFGMRGSNGVINLITRAGGWAYIPVKYSLNLRISGYYASRIFYSPQHSSDSNSAFDPDLRSTLLWKPDINLEGNKEVILNYYNGDNSSLIRIIAEGITITGIPVTGKAEYEVR
ncbi:MAG: TonB-dependent receptor plug domain-containing protein [Bacteroidota bacterium]